MAGWGGSLYGCSGCSLHNHGVALGLDTWVFCSQIYDPSLNLFFFFFFLNFLGLLLQRMEVPRLGVELQLLLPAHATATMQELSLVCDLYHSSRQCQILNPLSEARGQTRVLMDASQVH